MVCFASLLKLSVVDSSIGRCSIITLSDQTLMELLIEGLTQDSKKQYQSDDGAFTDCCQWPGVICNHDGDVKQFTAFQSISGNLSLDFIPRCLNSIIIVSAWNAEPVKGICDTQALPSGLEYFYIASNAFEGKFDMTKLPQTLISCNIDRNKFCGDCDLRVLPLQLESLRANTNKFSGSIYLGGLPSTLTALYLHENSLSGEIFLENLPRNLKYCDISSNSFSGQFKLLNPPETLLTMFAWDNNFEGTAVVESSARCYVTLKRNQILAVLDESGLIHPKALQILNFERENVPCL